MALLEDDASRLSFGAASKRDRLRATLRRGAAVHFDERKKLSAFGRRPTPLPSHPKHRREPAARAEAKFMGARTITKSSITAEAAADVIRAADQKAKEIGVPMAIAVVDESGVLKAFSRMDGAPLLSVEIAEDKAYSAAAYGIPTHAWFDFIKDDPPLLHGIVKTRRLVIFGGGYPLELDGVVGAIGVSGGHYEQDMVVAQAGVAALA
jgi:uncharacterized protein GlcG (DUF336 family)